MPGKKQDQIAAAQHVAYVAASYLSNHATRQELENAVADWSAKTDGLGRVGPSPAASGSRGGGGGTSLTHPETVPDVEDGRDGRRKRQRRDPAERRKADTWLTPYGEAWAERYGCPLQTVPWGQLARYLKPLHDLHGLELVLARWRNYLSATEARYASPARFAATFGEWDDPDGASRRDPFAPKPGESVDDYMHRFGGGGRATR